MIRGKKGDDLLNEQLIFIILNLIFFSSLIFFVVRSGSGEVLIEEDYAKKIGLILDSIEPNMEINISVEELVLFMDKNQIIGIPVSLENNLVNVKISNSGGYTFNYFSSIPVKLFFDRQNKILTIKS